MRTSCDARSRTRRPSPPASCAPRQRTPDPATPPPGAPRRGPPAPATRATDQLGLPDHSFDDVDRRDRVLVLPKPEHRPPQFPQVGIGVAIALLVAVELLHPPVAVGRGRRR